MPIVVVAAIAAGGAVAAGVVAASTVVYAGIAASVVGRVTKSKELSSIGTGMTLGAGIASAASSIFGAEGATAAGATGAGAGAEGAASGADGLAGAGVDAGAGTLGGGSEAIAGAVDATGAGTAGLGEAASGGADLASGAGAADSAGSDGLLNPAAKADALASAPSAAGASVAPFESGFVGTDVALTPPPATGIQGWWAKLTPDTKAKLLSGAANSVMAGWDQSQKNAFEREKFNLPQQQYNTSVSNANAQPVVAFAPVKSAGLLNPTTKG
jgi:hypothetical protein